MPSTSAISVVASIDVGNPVENDYALVVGEDGGKRFTLKRSLAEVTAQRLRIRLRFFQGEWFLDVREGVPYLTDVFGRKIDSVTELEPLFRGVARGTPGVATVDRLRLAYTTDTRALYVSDLRARLVNGEQFNAADWPPFIIGKDRIP